MSRWLIAMEGPMQVPSTGQNEKKTEVQVIDSLSGHPNKDNKNIEKQKSFDERENNPEGKGSEIEIAVSENGQGHTPEITKP